MADLTPTKAFMKALINTGVAQFAETIKTGGKALIRHMQRDPINLGAMDTVISVFSQAVLPANAINFANTWSRFAAVQSITHGLGPDFGVSLISQAQSALAGASGFSQTVFIISNLVATVGLPKVASALHHMRSPIFDIEIGDEAENAVTSFYSAKAIHTQIQTLVEQKIQTLEGMVLPLFASETIEGSAFVFWASSRNPDSENLLKFKLLQSVIAVSRFGSDSTPITYPIILNHLGWVVALAVIFGFCLECDGVKLLDKVDDHSGTIKLCRDAVFTEGTEILHDIHALIDAETEKENVESITIGDIHTQALFSLEYLTKNNIATIRPTFVEAAKVTHPETKIDEVVRESASTILSILDRLNPDDKIEPIAEDFEDGEIQQGINMLFMIELLRRLVVGAVLNLGIVVHDPFELLPRKADFKLIYEKSYYSIEPIWQFLRTCCGRTQPEIRSGTFSSLVGGQSGVIVPTLLLCKTHDDIINCTLPITIIPGTLTIRGKRSQILEQARDNISNNLKIGEVSKVRYPTCIWRTLNPQVSLLGRISPYRFKVCAAEYKVDVGVSSFSWMNTIASGSDAATKALEALGARNAPNYVCRNADSALLQKDDDRLTVWLTQASLAGKLLVLDTLSNGSHTVGKRKSPVYVCQDETFQKGLQNAHALGCKHMLV